MKLRQVFLPDSCRRQIRLKRTDRDFRLNFLEYLTPIGHCLGGPLAQPIRRNRRDRFVPRQSFPWGRSLNRFKELHSVLLFEGRGLPLPFSRFLYLFRDIFHMYTLCGLRLRCARLLELGPSRLHCNTGTLAPLLRGHLSSTRWAAFHSPLFPQPRKILVQLIRNALGLHKDIIRDRLTKASRF